MVSTCLHREMPSAKQGDPVLVPIGKPITAAVTASVIIEDEEEGVEEAGVVAFPAPPYVRVVLHPLQSGQVLPPEWQVHGGLSLEQWSSFWQALRPQVEQASCTRYTFYVIRRVLALIWFAVFQLGLNFPPILMLAYGIGTGILFVLGFRGFVGYVRKSQLESLRSLCLDEEARLFRSLGFIIECEFEWFGDSRESFAFCLYFLPTPRTAMSLDIEASLPSADYLRSGAEFRNGYQRIQLFSDGGENRCCTLDPIGFATAPPSPTSYSAVPTDSFDDILWARFWFDMSKGSQKIRFAYRLTIAAWCCFYGFFPLILLTEIVFEKVIDIDETVLFTVLASLFVFVIYSHCKLSGSVRAERRMVKLYSAAFSQRAGVYIEHRNVYGFDKFTGIHHIHYLCVFSRESFQASSEIPVVSAVLASIV